MNSININVEPFIKGMNLEANQVQKKVQDIYK